MVAAANCTAAQSTLSCLRQANVDLIGLASYVYTFSATDG
jgi:hypothetical protein